MKKDAFEMQTEYDMRNAKRGPVVRPGGGKTRITIRIDTEILNWFRDQVDQAGGGSYQTMINTALREHIQHQSEPLEQVLRRVIRQELRHAR